jgi:hypothetical protein
MKNLIGYIFAFSLCAFFHHFTWLEIIKQDNSGNPFANTLFLLGCLASFCGIITELIKLISKIILQNSEKK